MGYKGSNKRAEANVEYGAGRVGTNMINQGFTPYVRVVINYWGKSTNQKTSGKIFKYIYNFLPWP